MERRGQAFLRSLAEICREWPELSQWLFQDFAYNEKTRANFRSVVDGKTNAHDTFFGLEDLAGEASGWRNERARLQRENGIDTPRLYGGRTWQEMEQLIYRYQSGGTELGVFLLVRQWRKLGKRAKFAPELQQAGSELLDAAIRTEGKCLLSTLARAVRFFGKHGQTSHRDLVGYGDWWKIQALLFMLRNPRPVYRTRDVRAHLARIGIRISTLDFRRFTNRHGIRRDERAGRPRGRVCR